jgi:hypothetical protein
MVVTCGTVTDKRQTWSCPSNKYTFSQLQVTDVLLQALKVVKILCGHTVYNKQAGVINIYSLYGHPGGCSKNDLIFIYI